MSRPGNRARGFGVLLALGVASAVASAPRQSLAAESRAATADRVTLADGSEFLGRVVSLDAHALVVDVSGARRAVPRPDVRRIEFGEAPPPPLVARVKVAEADAPGTFPAGGAWLYVKLSEGRIEVERDPSR